MKTSLYKTIVTTGITLFLLLVVARPSLAEQSRYHQFVKGSFAEIQQQHKGSPYIIAFWSETCTFCMEELKMFGEILPQYPSVKLITITTDPFLEDQIVEQILSPKKLNDVETWVFAENFPERLYYDISKGWRGELPLTYFIGQDEKLIKHMGVVKEAELLEWLDAQGKTL